MVKTLVGRSNDLGAAPPPWSAVALIPRCAFAAEGRWRARAPQSFSAEIVKQQDRGEAATCRNLKGRLPRSFPAATAFGAYHKQAAAVGCGTKQLQYGTLDPDWLSPQSPCN
jgi:hypothetical protein